MKYSRERESVMFANEGGGGGTSGNPSLVYQTTTFIQKAAGRQNGALSRAGGKEDLQESRRFTAHQVSRKRV